jgi:hypothetical protein
MKDWTKTLGLAVALTAAAAVPAWGQAYRFGAAWNAGGAWFSPLNGGAAGAAGAVAQDLTFDPGWIAGLQFEQWFGSGRIGWRVNGAISERPLVSPGGKRDIGLWLADADVLLRLLPAAPERTVNVFLSAGAGFVDYKLGSGGAVVWESAGASYDGNEKARFAAAGGLGIDVLTGLRWDGEPIGIRFEVVDHVVLKSPFASLSGSDFDPIHNVRFVIGAFTGFGMLR